MRRADRLFQLVQILRNHRRRATTARRLAELLGVTERTIYRDIQDLSLSGVPILGEPGIGYSLDKGFDLPPLMFDKEEIEALTLGARIVQSQTDTRLARAAEQALAKIEQALPQKLRHLVSYTQLYAPMVKLNSEDAKVMETLRIAINELHKVYFDYTREDGLPSSRTVWPLGLFFWGHSWTLGAWCELRRELRNFRIDRIQHLSLCTDTFVPDEQRCVDALFREGKHRRPRS